MAFTMTFLATDFDHPYGDATFNRSHRNGHECLFFDHAFNREGIIEGVLPPEYAGGGLTVTVVWAAATATSGTTGFEFQIKRIGDDTDDLDSAGSAAYNTTGSISPPAVSGELSYDDITFTHGADMDSLAAGEMFMGKIKAPNDSFSGGTQIIRLIIAET